MSGARWEQYTTRIEFAPGEYPFYEDDPGEEMYIVHEGQVAIIKKTGDSESLVLGYRGPGSLIGELSLLSDEPRAASVLAVEPVTLLAISRDDFWRLMRSDDDFREMVMHTLIETLREADASRIRAAVLERDLFSRLVSLSDENDRLAELMQLRQETLHFIVHDLRNPLNLIMTALSLIEHTVEFDAEGHLPHLVASAYMGTQRMLTAVNTILDVEHLDQGSAQLDITPVDLVEMAQCVADFNQPMAEARQITLAVTGDVDPPIVMADRERIERVLLNLLDNALKFTPADGRITVDARADGDHATISVSDTGPGIPPDQRERIFIRFARGKEGRGTKGFGLGLAYCRSAVTAHGGQIWVEENEAGGARFVFTLPLADTEHAAPAREASGQAGD
jgi:signal transduction histidine kinase